MSSKPILEANRISKQYDGKIALSSLSFTIKKGELVAIIGSSGAGKTTLLNTIAGILPLQSGLLEIDGKPIETFKSSKQLAKKIGIIRQQFDLIGQLSVIHNVLAGRLADWGFWKSLFSLLWPLDRQKAFMALDRVGLNGKAFEKTSRLSGGEQQRVALARLLIQGPEIVLADEPVASLDPARAEDILYMMTKLALEENQTVIASLHSVVYAKKYFNRIIGMKNGTILFDLPSDQVSEQQLAELYMLMEKNHHE